MKDPRRVARECAVQVLFQMDLTGAGPDEAFGLYWPGAGATAGVREMTERLVRGVCLHRIEIDRLIEEVSENWRLDRMPVVDRNVLRLALWEFLHESATPRIVIIDEAIELAKKFGGEDSGPFVNGFLDAFRKKTEAGSIPLR